MKICLLRDYCENIFFCFIFLFLFDRFSQVEIQTRTSSMPVYFTIPRMAMIMTKGFVRMQTNKETTARFSPLSSLHRLLLLKRENIDTHLYILQEMVDNDKKEEYLFLLFDIRFWPVESQWRRSILSWIADDSCEKSSDIMSDQLDEKFDFLPSLTDFHPRWSKYSSTILTFEDEKSLTRYSSHLMEIIILSLSFRLISLSNEWTSDSLLSGFSRSRTKSHYRWFSFSSNGFNELQCFLTISISRTSRLSLLHVSIMSIGFILKCYQFNHLLRSFI